MANENSKAASEAEIRRLIEDRAEAVRAKDVDALMAHVAPDVVSFDVVNPLQYTGADAVRRRAEEWFSSFRGGIGHEVRDLSISAGDEVAHCYSLSRVSGTTKDGAALDMWIRATVCLRKVEGKWLITHQHSSVPFDVESGKASLDLKP